MQRYNKKMKYTRGGKVLYHIKMCESKCKLLKCNKLRIFENEEPVAQKDQVAQYRPSLFCAYMYRLMQA
jgi:hypothetical protein